MSQAPTKARRAAEPEPAWKVAYLFPPQGEWTEEDYLALNTNHLVELSEGFLEVLEMPTTIHQMLVFYLAGLLSVFVSPRGLGTVLLAPLRIRLWPHKFREPDVVFMHKDHSDRVGDKFWQGADLIMEVVSDGPEDRKRDLETKPLEYARAGIPEYWIVDPQNETITVLQLADSQYVEHGKFAKGTQATSALLEGFSVDVTQALSQKLPGSPTKKTQKGKRPRA
jgi:Uma2 family endonuclease